MAENAPIILNVDDDLTTRAAVTRVLREEGFEVREAATGKEALDMAAANPALIVLDANLPDLSGNEVVRRLRADPATAAVSVLQLGPRPADGRGTVTDGGTAREAGQPTP
ncbi:MAG TPA: response regulator [Gemmataceae bacterium]|nr:response regulator [Gemmataceae bacterium]